MDHTKESIQLVGRIAIHLEHRNDFIARTKELCNQTNTIESPPLFQCCEDLNAPGHFIFHEIWPSKESLMRHFQTPHFLAWNDWVKGKTACDPEIRIGLMEATDVVIS